MNTPQPYTLLATIALFLASFVTAGFGCEPASGIEAASPATDDGEAKARYAYHETDDEDSPTVRVRLFNEEGDLVGPVETPRVIKSNREWQRQLTREQFRITRRAGTEPAGCGVLLKNDKEGVYVCVGCKLPLFSSEVKFDSGTGWPSYFQPIAPENVGERIDRRYGMARTENYCPRCDAHLGHVFNDGPPPTGLRYCINSAAMSFVPRAELATLAEAKEAQAAPVRATAVFAGGCFWCVEAVFEQLDGVHEVDSGYAGGSEETATYQQVAAGRTDHAEVVRVTYDPKRISYEDLLRVHFATHDPTQLNRQGPDVGRHYRSAIFYADENEKRLAKHFIEQLEASDTYDKPIVTTLEPLDGFYKAESYHQNFVRENPNHPYVRRFALPKIEKVREKFAEQVKSESDTHENHE